MKQSDNIQEELQNIAPVLASLKKENGYSVPKSYWQTFTNKVIDQLDNDVVEEESEGYATPDNYFSEFNVKVLDRIKAEPNEHVIDIAAQPKKKRRFLIPNLLAAASIALLLTFGISLFNNSSNEEDLQQWLAQTEVFDSEIEAMLFENDDTLLNSDIEWIIEDEDAALDSILEDIFETNDDDFIS